MYYPLLKTPAFQLKFCDQLTTFQSINLKSPQNEVLMWLPSVCFERTYGNCL